MKYLFLSILMIGVGIGVVGCEDDDTDGPPKEEVVEEPTGVGGNSDQNLISFTGTILQNGIAAPGNAIYSNKTFSTNSFYIWGDNGTRYFAEDSLPNEFKVSLLRVGVRAEDLNENVQPGIALIRIVEIERL